MSYNPFARPNAKQASSPWGSSAPLNGGSWVRPASRPPSFPQSHAQPYNPFDRPGPSHPFDRPTRAHPAPHRTGNRDRDTHTYHPFDRPGQTHPFDRAISKGHHGGPHSHGHGGGRAAQTYDPFARPATSHPFDRVQVSRADHMRAFGDGPKHTSAFYHGHFAAGTHDRVCAPPRVFTAQYPLESAPSRYEAPGAPHVRGGSVSYF